MSELWEIFVVFFKIGLYAYGGGPAMIPVMQAEVVGTRHWTTDNDFLTALAIGNSIPGPIAPKLALWMGSRLAGVPGAMVASIAVVLPGLILMSVFTSIFWSNADSPYLKGAAKGAGVAVIGLLAYVTYDQAAKLFLRDSGTWVKALENHIDWVIIVALAFGFVVWRPNLMMPIVIIAAALYGAFFMR